MEPSNTYITKSTNLDLYNDLNELYVFLKYERSKVPIGSKAKYVDILAKNVIDIVILLDCCDTNSYIALASWIKKENMTAENLMNGIYRNKDKQDLVRQMWVKCLKKVMKILEPNKIIFA